MVNRLWGGQPDNDALRDIAESNLSDQRIERILDEISETIDKIRTPLRQRLANQRIDT